ncbi:unnamed protein product [Closterium sp. NIES-54]
MPHSPMQGEPITLPRSRSRIGECRTRNSAPHVLSVLLLRCCLGVLITLVLLLGCCTTLLVFTKLAGPSKIAFLGLNLLSTIVRDIAATNRFTLGADACCHLPHLRHGDHRDLPHLVVDIPILVKVPKNPLAKPRGIGFSSLRARVHAGLLQSPHGNQPVLASTRRRIDPESDGGAGGTGGTGTARGGGAGGTGAAGAGGAGGTGATGTAGAGAGGTGGAVAGGTGGARAGGAGGVKVIFNIYPAYGGAGAAGDTGTVPRRPFLPAGAVTGSLAERREPESPPASPVRTVSRACPPPVPDTHTMALRSSSVLQCVAMPSPPASSLPDVPKTESDLARAASPIVTRLLATVVTDPSFESTVASALVTELVDFATTRCLDYVASLVTESESVCPPSVGDELALSSDVFEDRQFELECLAAALRHFASMLLCPEGDPDALDIPTPRSYVEAITSEYSSQWQTAMDAEMASWKSIGTYVDEVPPPGTNIVYGMWIFRVKRPPGSPPAFKVRYVARGFRQRQGVDFFHTFSPTPKMTSLRVLLHVATQRDYELHALDFSTTFLQGSLHEDIWLRRPLDFTSCDAEIYAGAMAAKELRWLTYLLTDLGERPRSPPVLYVDNKAMISLCQEERLEHITKHIALRYFLARESQQHGQVRLAYVASRANTAHVFTMALGSGDHQRFCTALGLVPTLPHLLVA